ncbi:Cytochrome b561 domain-containing protein [Mycena kentingensis (nom. inval.)]|nr:Cytochrome b561 domain-containing protein [Mycena kentingensis (nom. inval.)]
MQRSARRQTDHSSPIMEPSEEEHELRESLLAGAEPQEADADAAPKREEQLPREGRKGDSAALYIAFAGIGLFATVNDPVAVGIFALHPLLQSLSLVLLTYGIMTLQPTSQPKTKVAGLARHQYAILLAAFPAIAAGTFAVWYNKRIHDKPHWHSWHGKFGIAAMTWIVVQVLLGGGSVWFGGVAFGGGAKAKSIWKYHRVSGYLLYILLMIVANLGGFWSNWGLRNVPFFMRLIAFAIAPGAALVGLYLRVRPSKMKFF